jgi:uncharacterized protein YndB with AHSA1/START domain
MKTMQNAKKIEIESTIDCPVENVWKSWTSPEHIKEWNAASADWHTTNVETDVKEGGKFNYRMEAKDGSAGFDFKGTFTEVKENELLAYDVEDGRKVTVRFSKTDGEKTHLKQVFETEEDNEVEMQRAGWQSILDNFKKYTEAKFG